MKRPKFQKLCQAVAAGENKYLENTENHQTGKLIACTGDAAEIDIFGKTETWSRRECQEFHLPVFNYRPEE
jgi:hypothetical protein